MKWGEGLLNHDFRPRWDPTFIRVIRLRSDAKLSDRMRRDRRREDRTKARPLAQLRSRYSRNALKLE